MAELSTGFNCTVCHQHHPTLPLSFSIKVPQAALTIPAEQVDRRIVINPDQCVLDNSRFYLRGRVVVPIHELPEEPFIWGVWAEVGPKDFIRTQKSWRTEGRESEPPFLGYLDTDLPLYAPTLNLRTAIQTQPIGRRPHFTLLDPHHPLAIEQRHGIPLARVQRIAETLLHPNVL